MRVYAITIT